MNFQATLRGLIMLVSCLAASSWAEIYQWTDAQGKKHFSDKKPQNQKVESFKGRAAVSFVGEGPSATRSKAKVRIFVTQSCPYCKKAKAFLRQRGTPFEELDVEASASADAEFKKLEGSGVPVILVGKQRMDGYDEAGLARLLLNAGL